MSETHPTPLKSYCLTLHDYTPDVSRAGVLFLREVAEEVGCNVQLSAGNSTGTITHVDFSSSLEDNALRDVMNLLLAKHDGNPDARTLEVQFTSADRIDPIVYKVKFPT